MGNVQGKRHRRSSRKSSKKPKYETTLKDIIPCDKIIFVDRDDGVYVWETHVIGRLPFKEPLDYDIVFHCDKLWQDDDDGWSMIVNTSDEDYDTSDEDEA